MINLSDNPVPSGLLVEELAEAKEHLERLIVTMTSEREYDESCFRVDMGHIVAHLNRAWARRSCDRDLTDEEWEVFRGISEGLAADCLIRYPWLSGAIRRVNRVPNRVSTL